MADNENDNHPDEEKKSLKSDFDDEEFNDSKAKFLNGGKNGGEVAVELSNGDTSSEVSFSGLGKDELMKFATDPFWVRIRIILFAMFWIGWVVMLVAAIIIIVLAPRCPTRPNLKWYENNVVYKMDPKSFKDTTGADGTVGKGLGDLAGIHEKVPYVESLGANALWITSFFKSGLPYDGQDVVDHTQVEEALGTIGQFDALRKDTKKKGMKIMLDFIPNHTGKKHKWFMKSQQKEGDYTDYYIWVDGSNTTAPNNWKTVHGESAWAYDGTRKQWYYFSYLPEYPDLNLNNTKVLAALDGILRFWLDKGVDGFNIEGLQRLVEKEDASKNEGFVGEFTVDQPGNLDLVKRWREIVNKYSDKPGRERALFGHVKAAGNNTDDYHKAGIQILASDALIDIDLSKSASLETDLKEATETKYRNGWMIGNEDVSRFGSREGDAASQKVYQVFMLLLQGTPIVYYGDEIAMVNGVVPKAAEMDVATKYGQPSRDPYRTPMLWNNKANAGFCAEGVSPWLPVNADYSKDNVQFNSAHLNGFSILESFKALVKLREGESFQWGVTDVKVDGDIVYFTRKADGFPGYLVVINRGRAASYSFGGVGDLMTMVYNSANTDIDKQFSMKAKHLALMENHVYIFQYE